LRQHEIPRLDVGPPRRSPDLVERARSLSADVLLCAFFRYVVPPEMLDLFGGRAVNFHPALLPQYRGPAPRFRMILNEDVDRCGGVTMHVMSPELDEGDVIASRRVPWPQRGSFAAWDLQAARAVSSMVEAELIDFLAGERVATPQREPSSWARRIAPADVLLDARMTAAHMRDVVERLADVVPLRVTAPDGRRRIWRFRKTLGPATGEPPHWTRRRVSLDAADQRVLLEGWRRPARKRARQRRRLLMALRSPG